jgi:hypothetical protein
MSEKEELGECSPVLWHARKEDERWARVQNWRRLFVRFILVSDWTLPLTLYLGIYLDNIYNQEIIPFKINKLFYLIIQEISYYRSSTFSPNQYEAWVN